MTLFIAMAVLWHEEAGLGWYILAVLVWLVHVAAHSAERK